MSLGTASLTGNSGPFRWAQVDSRWYSLRDVVKQPVEYPSWANVGSRP